MVPNRCCSFGALLMAATSLAVPALAQSLDADQIAKTRRHMTATRFKPVFVAEGRSQAKCEAVANRIFVTTAAGSECIAYFVTRGFEERREAVLYFGGDAISADEAWQKQNLEANERMMQIWADRFKVRYVFVSRVGMQGSSGNHAERRFPKETIVMNAVTDGLKARLGLDKLALAGHSGGSTIAASFLTMGRTDVTCAVLGSAPLDLADQQFDAAKRLGFKVEKEAISANVYDPSTHVGSIVANAERRIFVFGDPADTEVPFRFQTPFVDRLKLAGHHGMAVAVEGMGADHHNVSWFTLPAAGACLNKVPDAKIASRAMRVTVGSIIKSTSQR
jgi:pimeloyl-ACP methyl ester carboxylesterase